MNSSPHPARVSVQAPAKLNLGLEVVGRRADGYHDLATIFQAIDLVDELILTPGPDLRLECDDPALATPDNLALTALGALHDRADAPAGAVIRLRKGIPIAAGLGGASSDAAAALLAARRLWGVSITDAALADLAADLGSDVPFFLRGGTALATGRGEKLHPLPTPADARFVVVSPAVVLPGKTATLYAALTSSDFSDGSRVHCQASCLAAGESLDPALLGNAFARPLYERLPDLAALPDLMRREGAPSVALTGAGPSHYATLPDPDAAGHLARRLAAALGNSARVTVVAPLANPPTVKAT